ncbi:MAG TPA: outer membrane beta-barrel domain-containing protein [Pseudobdellovibrionaceae bacterium]|nr:outer membrane beta-barrel domain-containing protein [Pseudobdellovibrionaceae bacterium]
MKLRWMSFILCLGNFAFAADEVLHLPKEELAKESVLPYVEDRIAVKNRNVVTSERFEAGINYGFSLTEPVYNLGKLNLGLYYHWNEDHALGLLFGKNSTGLSSYATQLNKEFTLDLSRAPQPESTMMLDYNIKAYYGKMSLSKGSVFNLAIFGTASVGTIKYPHKSYISTAVGLGQKFYITPQLSFRADLRLFAQQAPIPFLPGFVKTGDPLPNYNQFSERMTYITNLEMGLFYLF